MLAATAARSRKPAVGVKGIVECKHAALRAMPADLNGSSLSPAAVPKDSGTPAALDRGGAAITWLDQAALLISLASVGRPSSIGSDGSRDHSFHDPKYMRTSFTPADRKS